MRARGVELFEVERGGDVTFHGPGQLVGYPIFDLKRHRRDLHWYLRQVEEAIIAALAQVGIAADARRGYTGVWTEGRKIASIGVHARDWVTWHGFALNVTTDLSYFDLIVPCGIPARADDVRRARGRPRRHAVDRWRRSWRSPSARSSASSRAIAPPKWSKPRPADRPPVDPHRIEPAVPRAPLERVRNAPRASSGRRCRVRRRLEQGGAMLRLRSMWIMSAAFAMASCGSSGGTEPPPPPSNNPAGAGRPVSR